MVPPGDRPWLEDAAVADNAAGSVVVEDELVVEPVESVDVAVSVIVAITVVSPDMLSEVVVNTVGELDDVLVVDDAVSVGVEAVVGVVSDGVGLLLVMDSLVVVVLVGDGVAEGSSDEVVVVAGLSAGVDLTPPLDSDMVTVARHQAVIEAVEFQHSTILASKAPEKSRRSDGQTMATRLDGP